MVRPPSSVMDAESSDPEDSRSLHLFVALEGAETDEEAPSVSSLSFPISVGSSTITTESISAVVSSGVEARLIQAVEVSSLSTCTTGIMPLTFGRLPVFEIAPSVFSFLTVSVTPVGERSVMLLLRKASSSPSPRTASTTSVMTACRKSSAAAPPHTRNSQA